MAATYARPAATRERDLNNVAKGPDISPEALKNAINVICIPPHPEKQNEWMEKICPQLLNLIESQTDLGLDKAATTIIVRGILGRKMLGTPGMPGWLQLIEPIHRAFMPCTHQFEQDPVVSEEELDRSMARLYIYMSGTPQPALVGRLIRPILVPLWGLANFARVSALSGNSIPDGTTPTKVSKLAVMAFGLLKTFVRLAANNKTIDTLFNGLMFAGTTEWTFVVGSQGGVALRSHALAKERSMQSWVENLNRRAQNLVRLLAAAPILPEYLDPFLFDIMPKWLSQKKAGESQVRHVMTVTVAQTMVEYLKDIIACRPQRPLMIIGQFYGQHLASFPPSDGPSFRIEKPDLLSRVTVATPEKNEIIIDSLDSEFKDLTGGLMGATNALTNILSSSRFEVKDDTTEVLDEITVTLRKLLAELPGNTSILNGLEVVLKQGNSLDGTRDTSGKVPLNPFRDFREAFERFHREPKVCRTSRPRLCYQRPGGLHPQS